MSNFQRFQRIRENYYDGLVNIQVTYWKIPVCSITHYFDWSKFGLTWLCNTCMFQFNTVFPSAQSNFQFGFSMVKQGLEIRLTKHNFRIFSVSYFFKLFCSIFRSLCLIFRSLCLNLGAYAEYLGAYADIFRSLCYLRSL